MGKIIGFTVVPYRHIEQAEVLGQSFLTAHPGSRFVVALVDHPLSSFLRPDTGIEYLRISELPEVRDYFAQLAVALNEEHLTRFLTPRVAKSLLPQADVLIYLEHEVFVYEELSEVLELSTQFELVVVPRRLTPLMVDGLNPTREFIWRDFYDSGLFALNSKSDVFVSWWCNRTEIEVDFDETPKFSFLEEAIGLFSVGLVRNPAYGLSFLNFDERHLTLVGNQWFINDQSLIFSFFKGYEARKLYWISSWIKEKSRFLLTDLKLHKVLFTEYNSLLDSQANSVLSGQKVHSDEYGWSSLVPGYEIPAGIRHVYRTEWKNQDVKSPLPATPFGTESITDFVEWLEGTTQVDGPSVQRFVLAIFIDRPDIYRDFVHGGSVDYEGLGNWLRHFGRIEYPITRLLTYRPPEKTNITDLGRKKSGVDVIGSFNSEHGLGEAGRLLVEALATTSEKISTISYSPLGVRGKHPFKADNVSENRVTVVALNPEQTRDLWKIYGPQFRKNRYVVGQWFWELEIAPSWYKAAFGDRLVDELWAPTRFIEQMLLETVPSYVPVRYMPLPLLAPTVDTTFSLQSIGLESRFTFLFTFDFGSVMKRKNPDAVVKAFKRAFKNNEGPQLIIKSINGKIRQREYSQLMWLCEDRTDIFLIDEYFDAEQNAALIANCDCYVSLHRSEGLGLTLAEAMLLEKPVIATNYSGNLDFMNSDNSFLVPWEYTLVGDDAAAYPSHARWAEPNIDAAAEYMRLVYSNPSLGREVGLRARQYVESNFSASKTGEKMATRLRDVRK